jgi:prepilin-type N-terminal cleavage/methylation domain-containing protein
MVRTTHVEGFTLIEMLVSLALFTIIATTTVGTLLVVIGGNSQSVAEQSAMNNLSFALDSMTREIRTGTEYYCGSVAQVRSAGVTGSASASADCSGGAPGISFREAGTSITSGVGNKRIAYYFDSSTNALMRQVGTDDPIRMTGADVVVNQARFFTTGTVRMSDGGINSSSDIRQPTVTIAIDATAANANLVRNFVVQTTVTQRTLDI